MTKSIIFTVATVICVVHCLCIVTTKSANILMILPIPSYSHQVPYRIISSTLSQRGHKVVVVTTDPINDPSLSNLTEINLQHGYSAKAQVKFRVKTWLNLMREDLWLMGNKLVTMIYEHPKMRKIYAPDSDEKFDVVIVEFIITPGLYALAHRFNAPLIGVLSFAVQSYQHFTFGAPVLPSHPSCWEMGKDVLVNLSFWQRIKNFIQMWYHIYCVFNHFFPQQQALAEKYLGKDIPDISDMERNVNVIFQNQETVITYNRPYTPNIVSFGGFHILSKLTPLPEDLERFLTDAADGFIYVSLGSNVQMSEFSEMTDMFRDVLASLPCKVLWKINIELPNKPDNIYIAKWFPQQSILAHPKIRLFVYQGGMQSTEEAVHHVVPLLGIPVFCDQFTIVNKMVSLGAAKQLDFSNISGTILNDSIKDMLNDKGYKERMLNVKAMMNDKPNDHLNNVIWWIEFVIRHKGVPHLGNSNANDPWYQKYDTDVIALLSIVIFVASFCVLIITYKMIKFIFNYYIYLKMSANKKEKIN